MDGASSNAALGTDGDADPAPVAPSRTANASRLLSTSFFGSGVEAYNGGSRALEGTSEVGSFLRSLNQRTLQGRDC